MSPKCLLVMVVIVFMPLVVLSKWVIILLNHTVRQHTFFSVFSLYKEAYVPLKDTLEAAQWCKHQTFKGYTSLPGVISMDVKDCSTAL